MWRQVLAVILLAGVVTTGLARAAEAQDEIQASGEVVDLTCYLSKGSKGARHRTCAQLCAKKGLPLGLLTDSGDLFLLIEDHDNPDPYESVKKRAGDQTEVTGKRYEKAGMVSIMVTGSKGK
jgi:hypothetical protein